MIALKETMKRRKIPFGKSIDIEKTEEVCTNMKQIENEMVTSINNEAKAIKAKVDAISDLLNQIYSTGEQGLALEYYVRVWHEFNSERWKTFKENSENMEIIFADMEKLRQKAREMLAPKNFEPFVPASDELRDLVDYYEDSSSAENVDLQWFIAKLHQVLPTINKFVADFSVDPANIVAEEHRVVKKLAIELEKIEVKAQELHSVLKSKIAKIVRDLKRRHEEQKRLEAENQSPDKLKEVKARDEMELEKLKVLQPPPMYFDATKNCLKQVAVNKTRLSLLFDDGKEKDELNDTKMFRSMRQLSAKKAKPNQSKLGEMAPPARPNSRRRLDAMELLERATSNRYDLNSSRRPTGAVPKQALQVPKFSSTMLSPQLRPDILDCSSISAISKASPLVDTSLDRILCESAIQPNSTVIHEKSSGPHSDNTTLPTIIAADANSVNGDENGELTVKPNENCSANSTGVKNAGDSLDQMRMRIVDDDLFNTSDTVLLEIDE